MCRRADRYPGMGAVLAGVIITLFFAVLMHPAESLAREAAKGKKRIALLEFEANNTTPGVARIVRNTVEMNLFQSGHFDVLERSQMDLILEERKTQMRACRDESCAGELGEILATDFVIVGSVDVLETTKVSVKVIDVKTKRVVLAETRETDKVTEVRGVLKAVSEKIADRLRRGDLDGAGWLGNAVPAIDVRVLYAQSYGYLKDVLGAGYGLSVTGALENIFINDFVLRVSLSYFHFAGLENKAHHARFIPLSIGAGYVLRLGPVEFLPSVGVGLSQNSLYYYTDAAGTAYAEKTRSQPIVIGDARVRYFFKDSFFAQAGFEYANVFEKSGDVTFISIFGGAGMRF